MAAPFSNFRVNSPRTRGQHPNSPRFSNPRQGVMPQAKRMPGSGPQQQKLGGYSGFCAVCNLALNSEFQTREHYGGRTHQSNVNMLSLTHDQPKPSNSGYSVFCTFCNIRLNSEFQTREHYGGKVHQNNMAMLGITSDKPESSNSGFITTAGPVLKRSASDGGGGPSIVKKVKHSPSTSEVNVKNHLELLHEYKPGLEFTITSKPGANNATLFTATVEIDGKKYNASASTEKLAQSRVASIVFAYVGSHIENVLAQKRSGEISDVVKVEDDVLMVEEPKKDPDDFTSLDDICSSASFSCFSTDVGTVPAGVGVSSESDTKATNSSGDGPSVNGASAESNVIDVDGTLVSGATADNSTVATSGDAPKAGVGSQSTMAASGGDMKAGVASQSTVVASGGDVKAGVTSQSTVAASGGDAKAGVASQSTVVASGGDTKAGLASQSTVAASGGDTKAEVTSQSTIGVKVPRSSTSILNFIWPKVARTARTQPSSYGLPGDEYVVTNVIDGKTFEGKASTKNCAKAYAAEDALVKLFGMKFERDRNGIPMFTGNTNDIVKARDSMNASAPADDATALEVVDEQDPTVLLNDLFRKQVTYRFYPQALSQWGLEHRCSVTVGEMTVEGHDLKKRGAKNRAALAAVAALKASGMYDRLLAEANARRVDAKGSEDDKGSSSAVTWGPVVEPQPLVPMNATSRLNILFPGTKYESQGLVVGATGSQALMVAVKVGEKVFTGTGSQPKSARANAAENALRTLGLWKDEDEEAKKQLRILAKAKFVRKCNKMALMGTSSSATGYDFAQQPTVGWNRQPVSHARARARGRTLGGQARGRVLGGQVRGRIMRGAGHVTRGAGHVTRGAGHVTRGAGHVKRGAGRGFVAQERRGGTATQGQRRARATATRGRGTRGRGSGSTLAIGGSYYDTSGLAFPTGLGHGGSSTLRGGTNSRLNFIGSKPRGSPGGTGNINANLLKMAHGSSYDMADTGYDTTSDVVATTYEATYDSSAFDQPTDPYAASATGFYGNLTDPYAASTTGLFDNLTTDPYAASTTGLYDNFTTDPYAASTTGLYGNFTTDPYAASTTGLYGNFTTDPSCYSIRRPSHGGTRASPRSRLAVKSRGRAASHTTLPSVVHHAVTSMSYTEISGEDGSSYGVTTQFVRGARASPRRRVLVSRGSVGRGALQSLSASTIETEISEEYNYDNASYAGYEAVAQEENYGTSYDDPSGAAVELYYPNDGLQYPNDMQYDTSSW